MSRHVSVVQALGDVQLLYTVHNLYLFDVHCVLLCVCNNNELGSSCM